MQAFSRVLGLGAAATMALAAGTALAGPQYLHDGYALGGYDAVAYHTEDAAQRGSAEFSHDHNGATWLFTSAENRDLFAADPEAYAPAYDGHCAFGVSQDLKVPGDPEIWAVVDGVLYVNVSPRAQTLWEQDVPGHIERATVNWPDLEPQPAADDAG